jgi:hypothetical protein
MTYSGWSPSRLLLVFLLASAVTASSSSALSQSANEYDKFRADYFEVKRSVEAEYYGAGSPFLAFLDCHIGAQGDLGADASLNFAYFVADTIANAKEMLDDARYPRSIWHQDLIVIEDRMMRRAFEVSQLPEVASADFDEFSEANTDILDESKNDLYSLFASQIKPIIARTYYYNIQHDFEHAALSLGPVGCGNGGVMFVNFEIDPPEQSLLYLPEVFFKTCAKRGDPYDTSLCPAWRLGQRTITTHGGNFRYIVRWPNCEEERSEMVRFEDLAGESDSITVSVRRGDC